MRTAVILLSVGLSLVALSGCGKSPAEIRQDLAPAVCDYLDKNFDKLDADKNGNISLAELQKARAEAEERKKNNASGAQFEVDLLNHIIDNLERIGHVTGSHSETYTDVTYVPIGDVWYPIYSDGTRTVYEYSISTQDIKAWLIKSKR